MSEKLPNMLTSTIEKLRSMVDVDSVVGTPITTPDGVTIIPVSKISVGYGGGGSDFASKQEGTGNFGGGVGGGMKVVPICFLVVKDGNVRLLSIPQPANSTAERIVDMVPDTLDRLSSIVDNRKKE